MVSEHLSIPENVKLEITFAVQDVLKATEKETILAELSRRLTGLNQVKVGPSKYRERHEAGLPLLLVVTVTTVIANVIVIGDKIRQMKDWLRKEGKRDQSPGISVMVGDNGFSIENCKTADDVVKIIREIMKSSEVKRK